MTVAVPVGNRLRALRKDRGMTIPQLAAATGLTSWSATLTSASNPSDTEPAVVLWLAVPNPYARL